MFSGKLLLCLRAHSRFSVLLRATIAPIGIPRRGPYAEEEPSRYDQGGTQEKEGARRRQPQKTGGDDYDACAYTYNIITEPTFKGVSGMFSRFGSFTIIALQGA